MSMVYKLFVKISAGVGIKSYNQKLADELHKLILRINSSFKDNIWGGDLSVIQ